MSEYQYYEFVAVDGPISDAGLRYARECSSRATVSRARWQNTYSFGDFHGSVETLLKYYDAHFYIANWGTVRLGLAFPKNAIDPKALKPYLRGGDRYDNTLTFQQSGERLVIWWERNDEEGLGWTEGEGVLDQLIGIREELMRGDYRALFLGWLADFNPEECLEPENAAMVVPPIPDGLAQLGPALKALLKQFPVDPDALTVAADLSGADTTARIPITAVLERFSASEMRALLARVADGGGANVMTELNRLTYPQVQIPTATALRCNDLAAKTLEAREARQRKKAQAAAIKRGKPA